jgi:hypothetical protein
MAVYLDYDRIKNRTPAQLEAENRWWASLSEERKREWLDRYSKEDADKETFHAIVGVVLILGFVILPGLLGCIELAKAVFR